MGCCVRCEAPEAFVCMGRRTSAGCERCRSCWQPACQLGRRPKRCSPHRPETVPAAPAADPSPAGDGIEDKRSRLTQTLARFDDVGANAVLDRLLADVGVTTVISEVIVPYLVDLGERWADGSATIAEEHFATSLIRGRLLGTRPRLGRRQRPTRPLGMPKRRTPRPRPDLLRDRPARPRLAHHLPGRRHPTIDPDRSRSPARTKHHRAGGDQAVASTSARRRGSNRDGADRHCGKRGDAEGRRRARCRAPRRRSRHRRRPGRGGRPVSLARQTAALARGPVGHAGLDRNRRQVRRVPLRVCGPGNVDHDRMVDPPRSQSCRVGADRHRDRRALGGDRRPAAGTRNRRDGVRLFQQPRPPGAACEPAHDGRPRPPPDRVRACS